MPKMMNTTLAIALLALLVAAIVIYQSVTTVRRKSANAQELERLRQEQERLEMRLQQAERNAGSARPEEEP